MNNEILAKFLMAMGDVLKEAKDFSIEQLPIVAKEILSYSFAMSIVHLLVGLVFLGAVIFIGNAVQKIIKKDSSWVPLHIGTVMGGLLAIAILIDSSTEILKIWLAPRVFLLEYIAHLLAHKG